MRPLMKGEHQAQDSAQVKSSTQDKFEGSNPDKTEILMGRCKS